MKIAFVSRGWWPAIKGGSEKFMSKVAEIFSRRGYKTYVITRSHPSLERNSSQEYLFVKHKLYAPIISTYVFSRKAGELINSLNPDLVIINSYWGETSPLYMRKSIRKIAVIHDIGLFKSEIAKRNKIKYFLRVEALKRVTKRVDLIVVPTDTVKNDLINFLGVDEATIRVLGFEGVDGPFKRIHIDNNLIDIIQVGRFAPNKGQLILLEAVRNLLDREPRIRDVLKIYLIGGLTDKKYLERVSLEARVINERFNEDIVNIVVDSEDIDYYYRLADLCVAPSVAEEGFGLTVLECMAYGKPVIASDIFVETGVASSERAIIVPRGDIEKLTQVLKEFINDPSRYEPLTKRGLEYASRNSWEKVVDKFEEYIRELMSR
ncbi:MAG: glycosyltransferase family 4 protein [Sulfolobales archaeon]